MTIFTGSYLHSVDDKRRITLPAKFRALLSTSFYISIHKSKRILVIYTEEAFAEMLDKAANKSTSEDPDDDIRGITHFANLVEVDKSGRIMIPENLYKFISNAKEVYLCGTRDHIEIWDKVKWDECYGNI